MPRLPLNRIIRVAAADGSYPPHWLLAANISPGGMFVRAAEPPAAGCRVQVSLVDRQRAVPFSEAEVVWSQPRAAAPSPAIIGFGLRFVDLSPDSRELLGQLFPTPASEAAALPAPAPTSRATRVSWLLLAALCLSGATGGGLWALAAETPAPAPTPALAPMPLPVATPQAAEPPSLEPEPPRRTNTLRIALEGPAEAVQITASGGELVVEPALAPGARVVRSFTLKHPARWVMDLEGPGVAQAKQVPLENLAPATALRVGLFDRRVRLVLDLDQPPARVQKTASGYGLSF